jgi:hypothetical protein
LRGRVRRSLNLGFLGSLTRTRVRRRSSVHRRHQRLGGCPRSYSQCPAKAYRIHIDECSRSTPLRKDSPSRSNAPSSPCIQAGRNNPGGALYETDFLDDGGTMRRCHGSGSMGS